MRILIAGCGYVGTELGIRLGLEGHDVWGLRRDGGGLPDPIRPVSGDLLDPELASILPEVDQVVYAAAADISTPEGYRHAYVDGVRNLQATLAGGGSEVERFVFVSSTAVYGDTGGGWVDERTAPAPEGFRGSIVLEGEELARSGPFPALILRLGGIYGPGRTRLVDQVRAGEARCPEGSPVWTNRIHRDDAAGILAHLLTLADPEPVYLGVDDEPADLCDVYRYVAGLLGVSAPVSAADSVDGPTSTGGLTPPRTRASKRCSNGLLRATGYRFLFPSYREGYRAMVGGG